MTKSPVVAVFALLLICVCLLASACGTDPAGNGTTVPLGSESASTTALVGPVAPETLGNAVVDTWSESMQALVTLLENRPEASTVSAQVQDLKESTIQSLVALGRQRETLSAPDKARVDSLEWSAFEGMTDETWYRSYNAISSYYLGVNLEFSQLVASFNILTQYSDFALLRQQSPDEATRLGVK
jgi:hypothetical protein